jgi:ribosome-associated protein
VKSKGLGPTRTEGEENGEWIIVDCGAAVVHLMQPAIRDYYHLEEIWGDKPVKMKIDNAPVRLVKASAPDKPVAAKKVTPDGRAAPAKKAAPARKAAASKAPAKKAAAKKSPVRKSPAKTGVTRTVGVKTAARKTAPKTITRKA